MKDNNIGSYKDDSYYKDILAEAKHYWDVPIISKLSASVTELLAKVNAMQDEQPHMKEVIFCKDCKHAQRTERGNLECHNVNGLPLIGNNSYCSYCYRD